MRGMTVSFVLVIVAVATTNVQAVINGESRYVSGYRYNGPAHKYLPPAKQTGYESHSYQGYQPQQSPSPSSSYNGPSHQYLPVATKPLTSTTTQAPLLSSSSSSSSSSSLLPQPSYSYGVPNNYYQQQQQQQTTHLQPVQHYEHSINKGNRYYDYDSSRPSENYYVPPSSSPSKHTEQQEQLNNYDKNENYKYNQLGYNYGTPQTMSPLLSLSSSSLAVSPISTSSSSSSPTGASSYKPFVNENSGYRYEKPSINDYYYQPEQQNDYYPTSMSLPPNRQQQQYNNNNNNYLNNNFQIDTTNGYSTTASSATGPYIHQTSSFSTKPNDAANYESNFGHGLTSSSSLSSSSSSLSSSLNAPNFGKNIDYLQMQSHSYEIPSYLLMQQQQQQQPQPQKQQQQQQQQDYHNHNHNYNVEQYNGMVTPKPFAINGNNNADKGSHQYHNDAYTPPSLDFLPPYY